MATEVITSANIKQLSLGKSTTANLPAAEDGTIMYDTTTNKLVVRANGAWEQITSA